MNRLTKLVGYHAPDSIIVRDLGDWTWIHLAGANFEDARRVLMRFSSDADRVQVEFAFGGYRYEATFPQHMLPHFVRVVATTHRVQHALRSVYAVWHLEAGTETMRSFA